MVGEYVMAAVLLVMALIMFKVEAYAVAWLMALCAGFFIYFAEDIAASTAERDRQQQAQRVADAKPRPVSSSADGCTVYAFKPQDRWLYFTRCSGAQTTTTNVHQDCHRQGKSTVCTDVHTDVHSNTKLSGAPAKE